MIKKLRGTYDILPEEVARWQYLEKKFKEIVERYGYREIRTPVIEETGLFTRSIGETTDIVEKEMYTFQDRKGRNVTLRPEGTASIVRAYLESGIKPEILTKFYYYGDMFRYDRPQKGRYREFRQFGIEAIGSASPALDAEVISLAMYMLESAGLIELELNINSVGCSECRRIYYDKLREYIRPFASVSTGNSGTFSTARLCATCQKRMDKNPLRIFDCKEEVCRKVLEKAPVITENLCQKCASAFEEVKKYLSVLNIPFVINPRLVRGLDYYTRTAFEVVCKKIDSPQQNALVAGGRYDSLIKDLGGPDTPAVGWAMGMERILLALEILKIDLPVEEKSGLYIASLGEVAFTEAFRIADRLRRNGFKVHLSGSGKSLKSQMREADRIGAGYTLILGGDELSRGVGILRDMNSSTQREIPLANLENELKTLL